MTQTLTRVYNDYASAAAAVENLKQAGLGDSHIGLVASNADGWHKPKGGDVDPLHDKDRDGKDDRSEGAVTGAGLGMLAIPGVGPVVAMGWLASLAAGAVAGGAAGGIVGALVESGTSKENAELYAEALRRGGAIVTAKVPDDEVVRYGAIMDRSAIDVTKRVKTYRSTGWKGYDPAAPAYDADLVRKEREIYRA